MITNIPDECAQICRNAPLSIVLLADRFIDAVVLKKTVDKDAAYGVGMDLKVAADRWRKDFPDAGGCIRGCFEYELYGGLEKRGYTPGLMIGCDKKGRQYPLPLALLADEIKGEEFLFVSGLFGYDHYNNDEEKGDFFENLIVVVGLSIIGAVGLVYGIMSGVAAGGYKSIIMGNGSSLSEGWQNI